MTPGEFISKWRASQLKESAASQEHFIDLCRLLGEPTPAERGRVLDTLASPRLVARDLEAPVGMGLLDGVANRLYTFQAKAHDLHFVAMMDRDTILIRRAVRQLIDRAQAFDMRGEDILHARNSNKD